MSASLPSSPLQSIVSEESQALSSVADKGKEGTQGSRAF